MTPPRVLRAGLVLLALALHLANALPDDAKRLLWLYCSLVTVSFPVEVWRQPKVPDSGSTSLDAVAEPAV